MNAHNLVEMYNKHFSEKPKVILDIGCHDLRDSIILSNAYSDARVYSFEANPEFYEISIRTNPYTEKITVVNKAVSDKSSQIKFYVTVGNKGASSILKPNMVPWSSSNEMYVVTAEAVRLDEWLLENNVPSVDLIWMDAQGAELLCLHGLGEYINDVKMIQTEVGILPYYEGHTLYPNIKEYLNSRGFKELQYSPDWSHESNVVFINEKYETLQ
jgi:FkbM family methyltransferase